ncbi:MAG: hypothetical protein H6739_04845 [Alphaproteobacteria bacterium]|nr:hypothetical protein [Alphaproteobacteria bacterium]
MNLLARFGLEVLGLPIAEGSAQGPSAPTLVVSVSLEEVAPVAPAEELEPPDVEPDDEPVLQQDDGAWPPELEEVFEERAAVIEYEGELPRAEAEYLARQEVAARFGLPFNEHDLSAQRCPEGGFIVTPAPGAIEKVEAIAEQALALGWERDQLFNTLGRLIRGREYGLVCYLRPGSQVVEVTRQRIRFLLPNGIHHHNLSNHRVPQPWTRRRAGREDP